MPEETQINSLQRKINTYDDIKMTGWYMEPKNDIIKSRPNQIDNTSHAKDIVDVDSYVSSETIMSIYEDDFE